MDKLVYKLKELAHSGLAVEEASVEEMLGFIDYLKDGIDEAYEMAQKEEDRQNEKHVFDMALHETIEEYSMKDDFDGFWDRQEELEEEKREERG